MLIGLTLVGYAIKMIMDAKGINALSGTTLALGIIDAALGLLLLSCGYSSLFYLRFYAFILGLIELGQIAVAAMFLTPSTRDKLIDAINPPADVRSEVLSNVQVAGFILIGVVAFQGLTITLVLLQSCALDTGFDENEYDQERALLPSSRKGGRSAGGADKFGALDDEVAASAASSRYREKNEKYYQKYRKP